jgi:hypothetical protein
MRRHGGARVIALMNMRPRNFVGGSLPVAVALLLGTAGGGCGESVATCSSVCPPSTGYIDDCLSGCAAEQNACALRGRAADFQAYLTCVGNAGGFPSGSTLDPNGSPNDTTEAASCDSEAAALANECGAATPDASSGSPPSVDAGLAGRDASLGFDSSLSSSCPSSTDVLDLGASCTWTGTCTVLLNLCGGEPATPTPSICMGGTVALPEGYGYDCGTTTEAGLPPGSPCPSPDVVASETACTGDGQCPGAVSCADGGTTSCRCVNGAWSCPAVSCGEPGFPVCPAGDASLTCQGQADCPTGQFCCANGGSPECKADCSIQQVVCSSNADCPESLAEPGCTWCDSSCSGPYHLCVYNSCMK